jgi:hypothetical protein
VFSDSIRTSSLILKENGTDVCLALTAVDSDDVT